MTKPTRRRQSASVQSPLETYLREINETSLLSADDEHQLAIAIGDGDAQARDRMVRANLRLVVNIARGYTGKGLSLQDLIEEGNLGLLRAVEGFDPAIGTRFSTYASYWIKQSIKRALINTAKTIRIPAYMVELLSKWRRASSRLAEELGRTPTAEEVGRVLGLPRKKLPIIKKAIRIYNLTPQTDQAEAGWSLGEMVMDERAQTPDEEMVESDNLIHVMRQLETMDPREATVLRMRFGLDDNEPRTLKEIGETLGLTRERVRQIETEALGKLAESLNGPVELEEALAGDRGMRGGGRGMGTSVPIMGIPNASCYGRLCRPALAVPTRFPLPVVERDDQQRLDHRPSTVFRNHDDPAPVHGYEIRVTHGQRTPVRQLDHERLKRLPVQRFANAGNVHAL